MDVRPSHRVTGFVYITETAEYRASPGAPPRGHRCPEARGKSTSSGLFILSAGYTLNRENNTSREASICMLQA